MINLPIWHHIPIVSHFGCTPKVFRVHISAPIVLHTIELERKDTGATIGGVRRSKCHATSWTTLNCTRSRSRFHFRQLGPISAPTWPPKLLHGIRYYLALYQGGHKEEEYHGALQHPHSLAAAEEVAVLRRLLYRIELLLTEVLIVKTFYRINLRRQIMIAFHNAVWK